MKTKAALASNVSTERVLGKGSPSSSFVLRNFSIAFMVTFYSREKEYEKKKDIYFCDVWNIKEWENMLS